MRVAKYVTGNQGIIVTAGAYHGLIVEVPSFSPSLGVALPLSPSVRVINAPDVLRYSSDTVSLEDHMSEQVCTVIAFSLAQPASSDRHSRESKRWAACTSRTTCSRVLTSPNRKAATEIVNSLRRDRILISACGAQGNVLKLRPPMPFQQ
ncbi:hypothetical protein [Paenarthrobacter nitroguajacolicus]|uniref:hypothetical protein n=1 Tax=Paenarthrobacter nitroguajacolicus TaxID=211146 RepID=UPI0015BCEB60|nr:hypothetical protein [Paenarthrobacter nitroguajacolicus]